MPRNLKLTVQYDGTDFAGWQRQAPPARTVQGELEAAVEKMTGVATHVGGAGRTDAGVHAAAQVANFRTDSAIPALGFLRGLNGLLPPDLAVTAVAEVDDAFDARRSARGKHYCYRVWNQEPRSPLRARTSWHVHKRLDVPAMADAARHLLGEHDFTAFRASDCDRKNPVRILRRLEVREPEPGLITIDAEATAFLKHMVRTIAGTLIEVGLGAREPDSLADVLAGRDRTRAGRTAPAHGLTLEEVLYVDPPPAAPSR